MATSVTPPPSESKHRVSEEVTRFRRWVRRNTSRDAIVSSLKTLAWVMPLTLLIWVYAEREQETPVPSVPILISVKSNDPSRVVKLVRDSDRVVTADLRGPRSSLDIVRAELARNDKTIQIDVPSSFQPGLVHEVPVALQIPSNPLFVDNGIKVDSIHPQSVPVMIDVLEPVEVPIELRPSDSAMLASRPVFTPAVVKITAPHQVIEAYQAKNELKVYADLSALDVLQQPGTHDSVPNIPLITPVQDDNVSLSQTTVKGSIEVKAADAKATLTSLPVWVGGAPPVMRDYEVQLTQPVITNVTVVGPGDKIQELMKPDSPMLAEARAWLIITREDTASAKVGTVQSKKLLYVLPKGVTVSPQDESRLFEFKLVNKSTAG